MRTQICPGGEPVALYGPSDIAARNRAVRDVLQDLRANPDDEDLGTERLLDGLHKLGYLIMPEEAWD